MTKTSHEAGEKTTTTASESVALPSEPDLGGDLIHTLEQSLTVSRNIWVFFNHNIPTAQIEIYILGLRVCKSIANPVTNSKFATICHICTRANS